VMARYSAPLEPVVGRPVWSLFHHTAVSRAVVLAETLRRQVRKGVFEVSL
jgi:hypothetical protein